MTRSLRLLTPLAALAALAGLALPAGCSGDNPYQASNKAGQATATSLAEDASATSLAEDAAAPSATGSSGSGIADNVFLPEGQDVTDCVGTLERPNCGSSQKGGWRQYLVMLALVLGVAFIAWRVARLVRRRDAIVNADT